MDQRSPFGPGMEEKMAPNKWGASKVFWKTPGFSTFKRGEILGFSKGVKAPKFYIFLGAPPKNIPPGGWPL